MLLLLSYMYVMVWNALCCVGAEGRAGMAAIVSTGSGSGVDLGLLARELAQRLPPYARPLFLRLVDAIDDTGSCSFTSAFTCTSLIRNTELY